MKLVDTTLMIDVVEKNAEALSFLRRLGEEPLFTTRINVFELLAGPFSLNSAPRRDKEYKEITQLISTIEVLELDGLSALRAAQVAGMLNQQGKPIEASDCLIAGIALANGVETIVTRNAKHFSGIPGLTVETY